MSTRVLLTILCIVLSHKSIFSQSVGIGTSTPNPNAILHINVPNTSQPQGVIMPNVTTADRLSMSLSLLDQGLLVYDTDLGMIYQWNGAIWSSLGGSGSDTDWNIGSGTIYNLTDRIGIGTNAPAYPMHVSTTDTIGIYAIGGAVDDNTKMIKGIYTGGGAVDPVAVQGICTSTDQGYGFGGQFRSNFVGLDAEVDGGAYNAFEVYGTFSEARGTDGARTGVLAQAIGGQDVIALQAIALNGVNNTGIDVISDGIGINARSQDMTGGAVGIYSDYNAGTDIGIGIAAIGYLGVYPAPSTLDIGLYAACDQSWGWAILTEGDVEINGDLYVNGNVAKLGGSFRIDHPQDPENKFLVHSFVESPDMMNVYNGNIVTDGNGDATIELPSYFESLNMDFRYQLTVIGDFAQVMVVSEIESNQFEIKTDKPNIKVSWQVTGIRKDKYAIENRIVAEVEKPLNQRGTLLYTGKSKSNSGSKFKSKQKSVSINTDKRKPAKIGK